MVVSQVLAGDAVRAGKAEQVASSIIVADQRLVSSPEAAIKVVNLALYAARNADRNFAHGHGLRSVAEITAGTTRCVQCVDEVLQHIVWNAVLPWPSTAGYA